MSETKESKVLESNALFDVEISTSIKSIQHQWNLVAPNDILFSPAFLLTIEACPPSGIKPLYAVAFSGEIPIGILYFQIKYIKLHKHLRFENKGFSLTNIMKKVVSRLINFQCLVCGNTLLTGQYGVYFLPHIEQKQKDQIIQQGFTKANQYLNSSNLKPALSITKDYFSDELPFDDDSTSTFIKFSVQPKMIIKIQKDWSSYAGYLGALKSKYRVRNNKVRVSLEGITVQEFDYENIVTHKETIHALYKQISDNAGFNAFVLHIDYFSELKKQLGDNIQFFTYWKDGKIIAFFTALHNHLTLDAHFLGYEKEENLQLHLYHNMLLDLLELAIDTKKTILDLSRTAVEIKTTLGAVPHEMFLYIRHENPYFHQITKKILDFVKPDESYIIRNPFKD